MTAGNERNFSWLAPAGAAFAVLTCYGTLAVVGLLSLLGDALAIDDGIWAGAIILFALLALAGIVLGWRLHRSAPPLLPGLPGMALILWTMLAAYHRPLEIAGFVCLVLAAAPDWQARRALKPEGGTS